MDCSDLFLWHKIIVVLKLPTKLIQYNVTPTYLSKLKVMQGPIF